MFFNNFTKLHAKKRSFLASAEQILVSAPVGFPQAFGVQLQVRPIPWYIFFFARMFNMFPFQKDQNQARILLECEYLILGDALIPCSGLNRFPRHVSVGKTHDTSYAYLYNKKSSDGFVPQETRVLAIQWIKLIWSRMIPFHQNSNQPCQGFLLTWSWRWVGQGSPKISLPCFPPLDEYRKL